MSTFERRTEPKLNVSPYTDVQENPYLKFTPQTKTRNSTEVINRSRSQHLDKMTGVNGEKAPVKDSKTEQKVSF
jgi:hypothetical protein